MHWIGWICSTCDIWLLESGEVVETKVSKAKNYISAQLSNVRINGNYLTYQRKVVQIHTLYGEREVDEQTSEAA